MWGPREWAWLPGDTRYLFVPPPGVGQFCLSGPSAGLGSGPHSTQARFLVLQLIFCRL